MLMGLAEGRSWYERQIQVRYGTTSIIIYLRIGMGYGCDQRGRRRYQNKLHLYLEKYVVSSVLDLIP